MKRAVCEGVPHHITARGTDRREVFVDDDDRQHYLDILFEASDTYRVSLWCYCLMPNHVHLLAVPDGPDSFSDCFRRAHGRYSTYFHLRHGGCGHLWQSRYFSCALGGPSVWRAMTYIELNPVRAGLVSRASEFGWSSAGFHCGLVDSAYPLSIQPWRTDWTSQSWSALLETQELDDVFDRLLESCTKTGRPVGDALFLTELERRLERVLRARPRGRPPIRHADAEALIDAPAVPHHQMGNMVSVPIFIDSRASS